jgi:hypothetical protein
MVLDLKEKTFGNQVRFIIVCSQSATLSRTFEDVLDVVMNFDDEKSFRRKLISYLECDTNGVVEKLLVFFGFDRKLVPLMCFVYFENLPSEDLSKIFKVIREVSNRTFVYSLLIGATQTPHYSAQGVVPENLLSGEGVVRIMKSIVDSGTLSRKKSNIRELLKWVYERVLLLGFFPILVGLASGIGEGFITRQVPLDRFVLYLDILGLYVVLISLCFLSLPLVLLYVYFRILKD